MLVYNLGSASVIKAPGKGVDLEQEGTVNGTPIYEFDLDTIQADDKPWRKPGKIQTQSNFSYVFYLRTNKQYIKYWI